MAFNIVVYKCSAPENKIDKSSFLTDEKTISVEPYGPMSMLSPQFILTSENIGEGYNYAIIENYGSRHYFIVDYSYNIAKQRIITLQEDTLSTWASRLTDVKFNFIRGAKDINETEDGNYPLADVLNREKFSFSNWQSDFFTRNDTGQRYLLRIADGRAASWDYHMDFTIGDNFLYMNKLFTIEGSWSGAYLTYTEIPLPPSQPYAQISPGTVISVYQTVGDITYSQDYEFQEKQQYGVPDPYYQLWAVKD